MMCACTSTLSICVKKKDSGIKSDKSSFDSLFPKNHCLSHLTLFCDFRFIYDKLEKNDCFDLGHKAYMLNMVFKYLLLKAL